MKEVQFNVYGKVQGVFFRKSFCYSLIKNGFQGGATNNREDQNLVHCTVIGSPESIEVYLEKLIDITPFNSLGANVEKLKKESHGIDFKDHDSNTDQGLPKISLIGVKVNLA